MVMSATGPRVAETTTASPRAWAEASSCQRITHASTGSSRVASQTSAARRLPARRAVRATAAAQGGASGTELVGLALRRPVGSMREP
jgi:hypothetical protein